MSASADSLSTTQVITITATVAPARSIVVNDQHQMTMIYSNTAENVTPKVYLNKAPGPELALTPQLLSQYNQIMSHTKNKVGVAIPVNPPLATTLSAKLQHLFSATMSTATGPNFNKPVNRII